MTLFREFHQFSMVLYKGLLLRKRHFIVTFFECIIPVLIASLAVIICHYQGPYDLAAQRNTQHNATFYEPFDPLKIYYGYASKVVFLYAPNNDVSTEIFNKALAVWKDSRHRAPFEFKDFGTEKELEEYAIYVQSNYSSVTVVGTVFSNLKGQSLMPKSLDYKIRYGSDYVTFDTDLKYSYSTGPRNYIAYKESYFTSWQAAIEQTFIKLNADPSMSGTSNFSVMLHRFPYPPYESFSFLVTFISMIQIFMIYGFLVFLCVLVKRLIEEKANRSKELLKMMGMTNCVYWLSSFANSFIVAFFAVLIIAIMYKIPVTPAYSQEMFENVETKAASVLNNSDFFLFFVILLLYITSSILFCMAVSTFFNKPVLGVVAAMILHIVPYSVLNALFFVGDENQAKFQRLNLSSKLSMCLLPNGVMQIVFLIIGYAESKNEGIHWSTMTQNTPELGLSLAMAMAMMLASVFIYAIIIWYVDAVWPWQYGVPKPFYFPFTKSYWCGPSENTVIEKKDNIPEDIEFFESEPEGVSPGIVMQDLTKVFRVGLRKKTAVNGVSMNFYSGQITALLGQNGAGKTTTINMLTGLYLPNAGSAYVNGFDIRTHTTQARTSFGICPQENILYDTLTVAEHLRLYAGVKGVPWGKMGEEATRIMQLVKIQDKASTLARNLSGGMKRKLCLAIAIIADSKILFLDEPTSGMDPENRRLLWDILLDIRHDRTIILTTHYMEEADILGDRIAIMTSGRIRCCGSPMFLKKKFGTGYSLHVAKDERCNINAITEVLTKHIPEAALESNAETEILYSFSDADVAGSVFGNMFLELESKKSELRISAFGLAVTTMDDVFLKVTALEDTDLKKVCEKGSFESLAAAGEPNEGSSLIEHNKKETLWYKLWLCYIESLLIKRFHYTKRHRALLVPLFVIPFAFLCLMLGLTQSLLSSYHLSGTENGPALKLDLKSIYGDTKGFYVPEVNNDKEFLLNFFKPLLSDNGVHVNAASDPNDYILKIAGENKNEYLERFLVGGSANRISGDLNATAWFNGEPYHGLPISMNLMHTALLRYFSNNKEAFMSVTNAPLPSKPKPLVVFANYLIVRILAAVFVPIAFSYLAASYILFPVHERITKAKLLQLMTGISAATYWFGMFLWDMLMHTVVSILLLLPFAFFNSYVFFPHPDAIGSILLLFLLFGWSAIPLCYVFSLVFKKPSTGFTVTMTLQSVLALIAAPVLTSLSQSDIYEVEVAVWCLRILPSFAMTWGTSSAMMLSFSNTFCDSLPQDRLKETCDSKLVYRDIAKCCSPGNVTTVHPLSWEHGAGPDALFLFMTGIFFFLLLLFFEMDLPNKFLSRVVFRWPWKKYVVTDSVEPGSEADSDVLTETQRIESLGPTAAYNEALVILKLTKFYGGNSAVENLSFAVHNEECFGLLGVNGAGKTSTFKMLTGDIYPTRGNAYIGEHSIQTNLKKFQSFIGYCPQYDALLDRLTGREMLMLFARLRGLTSQSAQKCVDELIKNIGLEQDANKETQHYSGGNKRKLSLGLAVIGFPSVILLDEPTSGVDPVSRRKIWRILSHVRRETGAAVILCTHSMEESETLCNRLAIMVNGQFRCLGSIQQLKSKFGQGYTVIIKLKKEQMINTEVMGNMRKYFEGVFPSATLKDDHQGMLQFHITDTTIPWSQLFMSMEEMKQKMDMEDYLISGTTLEQIFLAFARGQRISAEYI